ncbi:MAG TPA: ABC transporter permease [Bryobacteraceae bacterium]|nr:ABC transporter permease [Bryobacteraceae bacterium]
MTRVYWMEVKTEFLKMARMKTYSVSTVAFPLMFYAFFGLAMAATLPSGISMSRYLLATYGAFAVMGATLYAFGVGVAVERGMGWLEVKRASPMPPAAYFVAKAAVSLAFAAIVVTLLFAMGAIFGGVRMPASQWLAMWGALVAGAIPFAAIGLAIGSFAGPNSAPAIVNMVYLPLSFCGGLWLPIEILPKGLQHAAPFLPSFHLGQIALAIQQAPVQGTIANHAEALAAFGLVCAGVAWIGQNRDREKTYG